MPALIVPFGGSTHITLLHVHRLFSYRMLVHVGEGNLGLGN